MLVGMLELKWQWTFESVAYLSMTVYAIAMLSSTYIRDRTMRNQTLSLMLFVPAVLVFYLTLRIVIARPTFAEWEQEWFMIDRAEFQDTHRCCGIGASVEQQANSWALSEYCTSLEFVTAARDCLDDFKAALTKDGQRQYWTCLAIVLKDLGTLWIVLTLYCWLGFMAISAPPIGDINVSDSKSFIRIDI